jgi:hypothetical protein
MKILFAGILGGIAMFIWTSIAHLVLPLGEAGIQEIPNEIPNESALLSAMQSNIGDQTGLYAGAFGSRCQECKRQRPLHLA